MTQLSDAFVVVQISLSRLFTSAWHNGSASSGAYCGTHSSLVNTGKHFTPIISCPDSSTHTQLELGMVCSSHVVCTVSSLSPLYISTCQMFFLSIQVFIHYLFVFSRKTALSVYSKVVSRLTH